MAGKSLPAADLLALVANLVNVLFAVEQIDSHVSIKRGCGKVVVRILAVW